MLKRNLVLREIVAVKCGTSGRASVGTTSANAVSQMISEPSLAGPGLKAKLFSKLARNFNLAVLTQDRVHAGKVRAGKS
jgi:hypothetical protein